MTMAMIYGIVFLIEALIAFQYFEWMFVKPRYTVIKRFVLVLACYVVLFGLFELNILIFNFISFPVFNWIIIKFVYGQKTLSSVFHSVAMSVIMTLSEMVVVAIFSGISQKAWDPSGGVLTVLFLAILSKFVYFLVMFAISRYGMGHRVDVHMGAQGWVILVIPVCVIVVVCLLNYMCYFSDISKMQESIVLYCSIICLVIIIISFVIYGYLQSVYKENLDKTLQIQREKYDIEYYKKIISQDEEQKIMIHDIKKHISGIHDLLEHHDYDKAVEYIERIYESNELKETIRFSDDHMVNVILNRYASRFIDAGIHYDFDVRRARMDYMQVDDLTVLLCNMLDNASEAMSEIGSASVELRMNSQGNDGGTIIAMTNDCTHRYDSQKSGKPDQKFHGFGIKSMKKVAEKYGGSVDAYYSEDDQRFHTVIYLSNATM